MALSRTPSSSLYNTHTGTRLATANEWSQVNTDRLEMWLGRRLGRKAAYVSLDHGKKKCLYDLFIGEHSPHIFHLAAHGRVTCGRRSWKRAGAKKSRIEIFNMIVNTQTNIVKWELFYEDYHWWTGKPTKKHIIDQQEGTWEHFQGFDCKNWWSCAKRTALSHGHGCAACYLLHL